MDARRTLRETDQQIREQQRHIAQEKKVAEKAMREGHDPALVEQSQRAMAHFLDGLRRHRRILLERLELYRP